MDIYSVLKNELSKILEDKHLNTDNITITSKSLTAEEAIGITKRKDFPIISGKEIMLEADFKGAKGQAFTNSPSVFKGTLKDILNLNIEESPYDKGLFIAALNSVMRYLGKTDATIHCKNEQPELCSKELVQYIKKNYGCPKVALVGFQPAMLDNLKNHFELRVIDLNPQKVGTMQYGVKVEDGIKDYDDVVLKWADLILCTGSTICNGSITNYIDIGKPVLFYGTTVAGAAPILGLKRICFYGE